MEKDKRKGGRPPRRLPNEEYLKVKGLRGRPSKYNSVEEKRESRRLQQAAYCQRRLASKSVGYKLRRIKTFKSI